MKQNNLIKYSIWQLMFERLNKIFYVNITYNVIYVISNKSRKIKLQFIFLATINIFDKNFDLIRQVYQVVEWWCSVLEGNIAGKLMHVAFTPRYTNSNTSNTPKISILIALQQQDDNVVTVSRIYNKINKLQSMYALTLSLFKAAIKTWFLKFNYFDTEDILRQAINEYTHLLSLHTNTHIHT